MLIVTDAEYRAPVLLASPLGPGHRPGPRRGLTVCGEPLAAHPVTTGVGNCLVFDVALCTRCFPYATGALR